MAIKPIIQIGDPRLKALNLILKKSDVEIIESTIADLTDTMLENDIVGIAAPQIGINVNLFITEPRQTKFRAADQSDKLRVYINPQIVEYSTDESIVYEGCGSVSSSNFFGPVKRPRRIVIEAYDQDFNKFRLSCDGLLARVIQHEYDHLSGIEFIEKIYDYQKVMNLDNFQKQIRISEMQIEESKITLLICEPSTI